MIDVSTLKGLTQDSREVREGYLFAAFKGEKTDGCDYIDQAIEAGAKVILTDKAEPSTSLQSGLGVEFITDENPRREFARLVAEFYPEQPETIVAVTGTNGKTSVVNFVEQIWRAMGFKAASIGTLAGGMTTSDPVSLHKKMQALSGQGVTHLAMEASSHGLHQYRMDGAKIKAAAFTNLSRDHLDYHADMDEYLAAKSRLFTEVLDTNGVAILNADIPEYETLNASSSLKKITYGFKSNDLKILSLTPTPKGQNCNIKINNDTFDIELDLVGEFQVYNAICALGLVMAGDDIDIKKAIGAMENLRPVRGRLQLVNGHPLGAAIYVDYAHTPDALENVLESLRPHTENRLICLFGCGGDRDKGKRAEMGKIAATRADQIIITDDNPRSENPSSIRSDILAAVPTATEIADRRHAIHETIKNLSRGDVLVIAGKGHEQGQIFADHTEPFDDVTEAEKAIQSL